MRPPLERHGAQGLRQTYRQRAVLRFTDAHLTRELARVTAHPRVPDLDAVSPGRHPGRGPDAIGTRAAEVRRIGHEDVGQHVIVNVAAERHETDPIEMLGWITLAAI